MLGEQTANLFDSLSLKMNFEEEKKDDEDSQLGFGDHLRFEMADINDGQWTRYFIFKY